VNQKKIFSKSIERSREGYSFQDNYALFLILKNLNQTKKAEAYYVDLTHNNKGNSLDVKIEYEDLEEVYEFKITATEKNFFIELHKLLEYEKTIKNNKKIKKFLIYSPKIDALIKFDIATLEYIQQERKSKRFGKNRTDIKNEFYNRYRKECNKSGKKNSKINPLDEKSFFILLKSVEIKPGYSNEKKEFEDESELENAINGEINKLINNIKIDNIGIKVFSLNNEIIKNLLLVIIYGAKNGLNIKSLIIKELCNIFAKRKTLSEIINKESDYEKKFNSNCNLIIEQFEGKLVNKISSKDISEGNIIITAQTISSKARIKKNK
jgi:hypothetical protein